MGTRQLQKASILELLLELGAGFRVHLGRMIGVSVLTSDGAEHSNKLYMRIGSMHSANSRDSIVLNLTRQEISEWWCKSERGVLRKKCEKVEKWHHLPPSPRDCPEHR